MMLKKALTHKLTSRAVSRDVLTARFKINVIFEGKIAQLCALVKLTIFIVGIPILELWISNVIFSYYVEKSFASETLKIKFKKMSSFWITVQSDCWKKEFHLRILV